MKTLFSLTLMILLSNFAFASAGKVVKVQGNRAIVEFPKGTKLSPGTMLSTGGSSSDDGSSSGVAGDGEAKRDYGISYNVAMVSTTTGSTSVSATSLNAIFYINWGTFEIAPILTYSTAGSSTSATGLGVLGMYNFIANKPGTVWVPGVYGKVLSNSSTVGSASTSQTYFGVGGRLNWHPIGDHVAFNFGLDYLSGSTAAGVSQSILTIGSGIIAYW